MLIIGAKGFAKEVLEVFHQNQDLENLFFYDDVSVDIEEYLYGKFKILRNEQEVINLFKQDNRFVLGIGNPKNRQLLAEKMLALGGEMYSVISPFCNIGHYNTNIGSGVCIMTGVVITNNVTISEGVLINSNSTIGHDSYLGSFSEICPNVSISGNCRIGKNCFIGSGAVILPNLVIGDNVVIGAGAVVNKNITNNTLAVGIPAKVVREI